MFTDDPTAELVEVNVTRSICKGVIPLHLRTLRPEHTLAAARDTF